MIPKDDLIKVDAKTLQTLPEEKVKEIEFVNTYMKRLVAFAEQQRNDRVTSGVVDKPIVPSPPSSMTNYGELEFRFPFAVQQAG